MVHPTEKPLADMLPSIVSCDQQSGNC